MVRQAGTLMVAPSLLEHVKSEVEKDVQWRVMCFLYLHFMVVFIWTRVQFVVKSFGVFRNKTRFFLWLRNVSCHVFWEAFFDCTAQWCGFVRPAGSL
jgi:hypothetical protein